MKVLVTGGAGFIGSTIASACSDAGIEPVILDDLSRGLRDFGERFAFYEGDYGDSSLVRRVFAEHTEIDAVVHCAASTVVPESMQQPLSYYANNVAKVPGFLTQLLAAGCHRILFSSTAAMYSGDQPVVDESTPLNPLSPYAASKSMVERILVDTAAATPLRAVSLRYFNPIGSDPRLRTGLQLKHPTHALGMLIRCAEERRPFTLTGVDWPTRDGSGLRDYIHVWDLALAHVAALQRFDEITGDDVRSEVINLGTGRGTTVLELVAAFERVTGEAMPVVTAPPRPGDVAGCCASATKAAELLGWTAERSLDDGIRDSLAWRARLDGVLSAG